jgi:LysR family hydrogen peroxide-inducible transcriptional activator
VNLQELRAFHEVARERSFTRAARNLHYSQPTITAYIKDLEQRLGTVLLHRGGRRAVELTHAGAELQQYAERIITLVAAAERAMEAARGEPGGRTPASAAARVRAPRPTRTPLAAGVRAAPH